MQQVIYCGRVMFTDVTCDFCGKVIPRVFNENDIREYPHSFCSPTCHARFRGRDLRIDDYQDVAPIKCRRRFGIERCQDCPGDPSACKGY